MAGEWQPALIRLLGDLKHATTRAMDAAQTGAEQSDEFVRLLSTVLATISADRRDRRGP